jgi:hypothetical protein
VEQRADRPGGLPLRSLESNQDTTVPSTPTIAHLLASLNTCVGSVHDDVLIAAFCRQWNDVAILEQRGANRELGKITPEIVRAHYNNDAVTGRRKCVLNPLIELKALYEDQTDLANKISQSLFFPGEGGVMYPHPKFVGLWNTVNSRRIATLKDFMKVQKELNNGAAVLGVFHKNLQPEHIVRKEAQVRIPAVSLRSSSIYSAIDRFRS